MARFTTQNTYGYDSEELATLNRAWKSLPLPMTDEGDAAVSSMLDHVEDQLLAAYESGKRSVDLVAFYYAA